MKFFKLAKTFLFLLLSIGTTFSQVPLSIPYQAVVRNSSQILIANTQISLRLSIINISPTGPILYSEIHHPTTNAFGFIAVIIGQGNVISGSFNIAWKLENKFLHAEMDINNGTNFKNISIDKIVSVPYAFFSATCDSTENVPPPGIVDGSTLRWNNSLWLVDTFFTNKGNRIGVANTSPDSSAILEMKSTQKGFLIPRMTQAEIDNIDSPAVGLQIYNLDAKTVQTYNDFSWTTQNLQTPTGTGPVYGSDSWRYKSTIGPNFNVKRINAISFVLNEKAYIGTGANFINTDPQDDIWEYNKSTNTWMQKADFPGGNRTNALGFAVNGKGYIGLGFDGSITHNDIWEYNSGLNTWIQKNNFPGNARSNASAFVINNKAYVTGSSLVELWEYNPLNDSWLPKQNMPSPRNKPFTFSYNDKGYVVTGQSGSVNNLWEYNSLSDTWVAKADLPAAGKINAMGFIVGSKAFVGTNDLWEYNILNDTWKERSACPKYLQNGTGFAIDNKGYFLGASSSVLTWSNELWEYKPEVISNSYSITLPGNSSENPYEGWVSSGSSLYTLQKVGIGTTYTPDNLSVTGRANITQSLGIGVVTPLNKLDVAGGAVIGNFTGVYSAPVNGLLIASLGVGTAAGKAQLHVNGSASIGYLNTAPANGLIVKGKVGLGTPSPVNQLDIGGSIAIGTGYASVNTAPANGAIIEGKTGLGLTAPVNLLDVEGGAVVGNSYAGSVISPLNGMIVEGNVSLGSISSMNKLDVSGGVAIGGNYSGSIVAPSNGLAVEGKIGIGTTSLPDKLNVEGNAAIGTGYSGIISAPTNGLIIEGNVAIGATSTSHKLNVNGPFRIGANGNTINNIIRATNATSSLLILGNSTAIQSYNISNAVPNSSVSVSPNSALNSGITIDYARVISNNTVEIIYRNLTGGNITLTSGIPLYFTIIK